MKVKEIILSMLLTFLFCSQIIAQKEELVVVIDSTIAVIKSQSIYANKVNWKKVKKNSLLMIEDADTIEDIIPALRYIFEATNDFHGQITFRDSIYKHKNFVIDTNRISQYLKAQLNKRPKIDAKKIEGDIGYLLIPSVPNRNREGLSKVAQAIQDSLCSLNPQSLKGLIIDLRLNGGGNMFPMISGIINVLGEGKSGSFMKANNRIKNNLIIKNSLLLLDTISFCDVTVRCRFPDNIKIAVLISPATGSSGEATAIAFKQKDNAMFFGEDSYGFCTATQGFYLPNGIHLLLSTSIMGDRKNKTYEKVQPDIFIFGGDNFEQPETDKKIIAALKWMRSKK
jgi:carboxyl-terminal processing protease